MVSISAQPIIFPTLVPLPNNSPITSPMKLDLPAGAVWRVYSCSCFYAILGSPIVTELHTALGLTSDGSNNPGPCGGSLHAFHSTLGAGQGAGLPTSRRFDCINEIGPTTVYLNALCTWINGGQMGFCGNLEADS